MEDNLKQYVNHDFTQNRKIEFERSMNYVEICLGTYHHCEIITYGKDHMYVTIIIHYIPKEK